MPSCQEVAAAIGSPACRGSSCAQRAGLRGMAVGPRARDALQFALLGEGNSLLAMGSALLVGAPNGAHIYGAPDSQ